MQIKYFCPRWGSSHLPIEVFAEKVKNAGYHGVETSLPPNEKERDHIVDTIRKFDLLVIAQHHETATTDFSAHKKEYAERIENLAQVKPLLINSQAGRDFFTFEQNAELIVLANEIADRHGIQLVHETHRGKFSFAAHIVANFIQQIPGLRLGFDVSHWCNVAETYLHDQQENVDLAISRADHIHARVGFPEGPQIPDPRVPEWQEAVDIHLAWWQKIIDRNKKEGKEMFTITPEFGPYPYMTVLPFTQQPISNQWEINLFMMELLKSRLV